MVDHSNFYVRRALWEGRGKRCVYCREPLTFAELEIDHVIPQALRSDPKKLQEVLQETGLDQNFDILSLENLVPSCRPCNGKKLDSLLPFGRAAIEISDCRKAKSLLEELIKKFKKENTNDIKRFKLLGAIQSGLLSAEDIEGALATSRIKKESFRLNSDFWLSDGIPLRELSKANIDLYLNQKVVDEDLRLVRFKEEDPFDNSDIVFVSTLKAYKEAMEQNYYPYNTYEINIATVSFERPLTILNILESLQIAQKNFIDDPKRGLADLSLLPAELLVVTEDYTTDENFAGQKARLIGKNIQELVNNGEVKILQVGSDYLQVKYSHNYTFLFELMRADIDGDGIQDILISRGGGPVGGTLRFADVTGITRLSEDSHFSTIHVPHWHVVENK